MIDDDFSAHLEYSISRAIYKSGNGFWCDGIIIPEIKNINELFSEKLINGTAIMPKGQYENDNYRYSLIIYLGEISINNLKIGKRIENCIPDDSSCEWIKLYSKKEKVEVILL